MNHRAAFIAPHPARAGGTKTVQSVGPNETSGINGQGSNKNITSSMSQDQLMDWHGKVNSIWKRSASVLGLIGWLLATIMGSGPSRAAAGGIEAQTPVPTPTLHGVILTTNSLPITNATVTIKKML